MELSKVRGDWSVTPTKRNRTVMVFGCFDGIHAGHHDFLRNARKYGQRLVAVVARDCNVKKKKPRVIHSERERLALVSHFVDEAFLGSEEDFYAPIKKMRPDVIVIGYDQDYDAAMLSKKIREFGLKTRVIKLRKGYAPERCKSSRMRKVLNKII